MNKNRISTICRISVSAAIICVCSFLTVPTPIPFTLQTFAISLSLMLLGGKNGLKAILLYILLGLIGLPVFSGFSGGIGHILSPTGGYIIGFIFTGIIYILFEPTIKHKNILKIPVLLLGTVICYSVGTVWFYFFYTKQSGNIGILSVLTMCVLPFIVPDIIKIVLAYLIDKKVSKYL